MLLRSLLLILSVSFLAACSSTPATDLSEQALLIPQKFELELKDNTPGTLQPVGKINLEYVELENTSSHLIEDKINKSIRHLAGMDDAYSGNTDVVTTVKLARLTQHYALVVLETYSYRHGAANGQTKIVSAYFNLDTGQQVKTAELFKPGYQQALSQEVKSWLDKNEISHEFNGLKDNSCFYQQHQNNYFCFSQYEIAAGAEGVILVPIATDSINAWLNPKGLLGQ